MGARSGHGLEQDERTVMSHVDHGGIAHFVVLGQYLSICIFKPPPTSNNK